MTRPMMGRQLLKKLQQHILPAWTIPKVWSGSTIIILGGGPSVKNIDFSLFNDHKVIAVNNSYLLGDWDICFFGDERWYYWHKQGICNYKGKVVTCNPHNQCFRNVIYVERDVIVQGLSTNPKLLRWNWSSGAAAINLATLLGGIRIVLVGFDMKTARDGDTHWHGYHKQLEAHNPKLNNPYKRQMMSFGDIKRDADSLGIEIINANPDSAIEEFLKMELKDVL